MKERPLLYSGPMVRAILERRKTQTRRVILPQPQSVFDHGIVSYIGTGDQCMQALAAIGRKCPYGQPGDRLWVRETFCHAKPTGYDARPDGGAIWYRATDSGMCEGPWRPSIHMPRWASRLSLIVESIRGERIQSISHDDCVSEGWDVECGKAPNVWFRELWDKLYAARGHGWDANPWVWVVGFSVVETGR